MAESQYSDLYKNCKESIENKQTERRQQMLKEQKQHRSNEQDNSRNIDKFLQSLKHKTSNKKTHKRVFKDYLQLSEWLHERPDDLDNWFLVPCPKGQRCLVVATNGSTKTFTKWGVFENEFRSALPGDLKLRSATTILDCFRVDCHGVKIYMVLDVMYYANTDLLNCETSFRFFWVGCKLTELDLETVNFHNEYAFKSMKYVDCGDEIAVDTCLATCPMWAEDDQIDLDGLLFYHKDSSYVHGSTPLVGWLFPYMVSEVLGYSMVNPKYLQQRPGNYTNAAQYIEEFENEQKKRRNQHRRTKNDIQKMEEDQEEDNETLDSLLDAEKRLEIDGVAGDDVHYDTMERD